MVTMRARFTTMSPPNGLRGAVHADLIGASSAFRYRPTRVAGDALAGALTCEIVAPVGNGHGDTRTKLPPLAVLDVSPTGIGISPPPDTFLPQGTTLGDV